jgi:predicted metal-dependent HD superfamily phosphohydrolase
VDLEARWRAVWAEVASGDPLQVLTAIVDAYGESHRAYHNLDHLVDCLAQLDHAAQLPDRFMEVELALWFHDVIYKPLSSRNETASASYARRALRGGGVDERVVARVERMILDTQHREAPASNDGCVVVDIDLSVLASEGEAYRAYESGIRQEFSWIPGQAFRQRRIKLLQRFLAREHIYYTRYFRDRYEDRARQNLERAIRRLRRRS